MRRTPPRILGIPGNLRPAVGLGPATPVTAGAVRLAAPALPKESGVPVRPVTPMALAVQIGSIEQIERVMQIARAGRIEQIGPTGRASIAGP